MRIFSTLLGLAIALMVPVQAAASEPDGSLALADTLSGSVVTGTRVAMDRDRVPAPLTVVSRGLIEQSDAASLLPVLTEQVPGLFVTSRGVTGYGVSGGAAGGISLRGFSAASGRTLVLIDGHPQYMSIYGHAVADEYLSDLAERVEVTRGAASLLYGSNALGGAINIITRQPDFTGNRVRIKMMGGMYGSVRGSVTEQYATPKFSLTANFSHDRTDGHRPNAAYHANSGMLKASYRFSDAWRLSGNVNILNAYSQNPGTEAAPMVEGWADILRMMSWISVENNYERCSGAVNFYYNSGRHKIDDGYKAGGKPQPFLFNSTDFQGGFNAFEALRFWRGGTLTLGLDLKLYGGDAFRNPETEYYARNIFLHEEAGYVLLQQLLGPVSLEGGVRLEHHSLYGLEAVPQAGVSWVPNRHVSVKLSASKGFRTPNIRELYMYVPANAALLPERAWSYDLTVAQHWLDGRLNAEVSAFYTKGDNIVEVAVVDGKKSNRNVGQFANAGVEVSASFKALDNLSFQANYSFLHMSKTYEGVPVHKLYLGGTWNPGRFSAHLGAMGIKDLYLVAGDTPQTSSYVDLKCRFSYAFTRWLTVFARGENLLNRRYETLAGFPEPGITAFGGVVLTF